MRQRKCGAVLGVLALRDLVCLLRRRGCRGVPQHVGERGLLAADQQQREQQGKERMEDATHGVRIRTQGAESINLQQQALQVFAFGKGQVDRMIGGALQALHDARRASGVERSPGDDFLEQFRRDAARA